MAATHSLDLESSSSQYASIADASCPNLEISGSQTWEGWVKKESSGSNKVISSKGKSSVGAYHQLAISAVNEKVDFLLSGLTTNTIVSSTTTLQNGVWYHVAGVYDSSANTLKIYINGEIESTVTASGSATDTNSAFAIGCNFSGGSDAASSFMDGIVRNVRVWNVARTQQQIRDNMNVNTPVGTGLQGNWILNNAYTDSSGNGYTLTASGSPVFSTTYPDAIDLVENQTFTKKHKITVQHTQVAGSANLTDVPIVFTESNFLSEIFTNSQGSEINTNKLKTNSNLIAYYRFESGALTTDSKGSNTLTNNNSVSEATGKFGIGADFGSSNTNKYFSRTSFSMSGSNLSFNFWIKPYGNLGNTTQGVFDTSANSVGAMRIYGSGAGALNYEMGADNGRGVSIGNWTNEWHMVTLTLANTTVSLYIDGVFRDSYTTIRTPAFTNLDIGRLNSTNYLSAILDDFSAFNITLSAEEVRSLYAGGQDLRFSSDIDGKTRLAHEIVSFDKGTSKAEVWVKANTLDFDDNTEIYVHYGNATASAIDENEAFGKHQVYNSNFTGVWHLQSSSTDSTQNNNDGTDTAITYNSTNGKIKNGAGLNGSSSFINIGNKSLFTSNLTILMWVNPNATQSSSYTTILSKHSNGGYAIEQDNLNVNSYYFGWDTTGAGAYTGSAIKTQLTADTWQHFAITKSGATATHYVNASQSATGNGSSATISTNSVNVNIGRWTSGTARYFNGELDTLMVLNTNLSADYISTIYNNQNSPSTFAIPSGLANASFLLNFV